MRQTAWILATSIALWAAGCIDKGKPERKIDPRYIEEHILKEAPGDLDATVNADLGGKVIYLGNKVDTKVLSPGGAGRVIHYWKVVEAPGSDWRVFTHLNGSGGQWMNLDATDMRTGYPTSKWKAGDIIADEQKFTLDANWKGKEARMTVGLYRQGGQGVADRLPIVSGPKDDENRVPVFVFTVEGKPVSGSDTIYAIRKADGPITIDGRADEPAWKNAPKSPNFTDAEGGPVVGGRTTARLLWDDQNLYAFIEVGDSDVYSQYQKHDDSLWKEDVVELFIDADRNRRGYVELQVNPNNAHFDAWFPQTRGGTKHFEWTSKMQSAVVVHGTKDDRDDTDEGWDVEISIPLADVKGLDANMKISVPPRLGDQWRLNVVRVEKPRDASLGAATWNPITIQDFHALDRMLTVVFADVAGAIAVAPETAQALPAVVSDDAVLVSDAAPAPAEGAASRPSTVKVHRQPIEKLEGRGTPGPRTEPTKPTAEQPAAP